MLTLFRRQGIQCVFYFPTFCILHIYGIAQNSAELCGILCLENWLNSGEFRDFWCMEILHIYNSKGTHISMLYLFPLHSAYVLVCVNVCFHVLVRILVKVSLCPCRWQRLCPCPCLCPCPRPCPWWGSFSCSCSSLPLSLRLYSMSLLIYFSPLTVSLCLPPFILLCISSSIFGLLSFPL